MVFHTDHYLRVRESTKKVNVDKYVNNEAFQFVSANP